MKKLIAVIMIFSLTALSCEKTETEKSLVGAEVTGIVKDFTGLDGCGKMIVLDSGQKLELVSLPPNTTLIVNSRVAVTYTPVNRASICMAGLTVEITSLRYL